MNQPVNQKQKSIVVSPESSPSPDLNPSEVLWLGLMHKQMPADLNEPKQRGKEEWNKNVTAQKSSASVYC